MSDSARSWLIVLLVAVPIVVFVLVQVMERHRERLRRDAQRREEEEAAAAARVRATWEAIAAPLGLAVEDDGVTGVVAGVRFSVRTIYLKDDAEYLLEVQAERPLGPVEVEVERLLGDAAARALLARLPSGRIRVRGSSVEVAFDRLTAEAGGGSARPDRPLGAAAHGATGLSRLIGIFRGRRRGRRTPPPGSGGTATRGR